MKLKVLRKSEKSTLGYSRQTRAVVLYIAAALLFIGVSPLLPPSYQRILVLFLMYCSMAVAWIVVLKMGYVSLGTAAFYGTGAYFFAYAIKALPGVPYVLIAVASIPLVALIAAVVGYVTMRLEGIFFIFATFAAAEALRQIFMYLEINYSGYVGKIIPSSLSAMEAVVVFSILLSAAGVLYSITSSQRIRVVIDFIREDELLARSFGVNTLRYKLAFFTAASALQGVTGAFAAWYLAYIDPDLVFNPMVSIQVLVIGLLGGTGSFFGPVLASGLIVFLSEQLVRVASHMYLVLLGVGILLAAKFLKEGFSGFIFAIQKMIGGEKDGENY